MPVVQSLQFFSIVYSCIGDVLVAPELVEKILIYGKPEVIKWKFKKIANVGKSIHFHQK